MSVPTCNAVASPLIHLKGIPPCQLLQQTRWGCTLLLSKITKPFLCHSSKQGPPLFCCETPPPHTLFPKLCLKSVYQQAQQTQTRPLGHKTWSFGLLPFFSSLRSTNPPPAPGFLFLPCWIIYLPSWPESPTLCCFWARDPGGREFSGSDEDKHAFEGKASEELSQMQKPKARPVPSCTACLLGPGPTYPLVGISGGSLCSKEYSLWK